MGLRFCDVRVTGVVQGVGYRPFVYRLARAQGLAGWVRNGGDGVEIHVEGEESAVEGFVSGLRAEAPAAAVVAEVSVAAGAGEGAAGFAIVESSSDGAPTVRISPDLAVCDECLEELFTAGARRRGYPYINCTNCGPRYTIVRSLPYDRARTTMRAWPMDSYCSEQYHDPADRRFHAQPVACPACGPHYRLEVEGAEIAGDPIAGAARMLREGKIVAVKGLGGYHLACDASNAPAVLALRERKFRKEKPFAVMTSGVERARELAAFSADGEAALVSAARPIVLARARRVLAGVAPDTDELGVMLPYTPVHHLLFAAGAPDVLVMTSANRSNEPIAYEYKDALDRLAGIADAFLIGERPIARRVDDSVVRDGAILRRARGYAPGSVARIPSTRPVLALGADLKNAITLVVDGQAFVSQHIGDLEHVEAYQAFTETIRDLTTMYGVEVEDALVVHDSHPQYFSSRYLAGVAVQHHRAHIASVIAEREAWGERVVGVAFDGTGYGDDGSIWGGEIFVGSVASEFERVAHLRQAWLPGGDAAARNPVQAAAGFLCGMEDVPDLGGRFAQAAEMARRGVRTFATSSMGRLFDTAAALCGFTRGITFEGQAAMWLEHLASGAGEARDGYPFPELDYEPLLRAVIEARRRGDDPAVVARRFHRGIARGVSEVVRGLGIGTVVLSGGVFQNRLLTADLREMLGGLEVWTNRAVPTNDGGISLGQAALAVFGGGPVGLKPSAD
jgi:hydrogenase maturation protein HypF